MERRKRWLRWLLMFVVIRMVLNAANRMAYPFLREFQTGLGLSLEATTHALALRSASLVVGPALAWLPERRGRRAGMLFGLALFVAGMVLGATWASWWGFTLALVLAAWAKVAFDASMQAFVGDRVAYERRGAVLAATELSWSLSFFVGMPLVGLMLSRGDWRTPFWVMAILGVGFAWAVARGVTPEPVVRQKLHERTARAHLLDALRKPAFWLAVAFGLFATAANESVGLLFGVWLSDAYGFALSGLGLAAAIIGLAELSGEGLTVLTVDGFGKRRLILAGLAGNMAAAATLPWLGRLGPTGALAGLFVFFLTFEVLLVGSIPLMTEILPHQRALTMGAFSGSVALGRALGAALAPRFYASGGVAALTLLALAFNLMAVLVVTRLRPAGSPKTRRSAK